MAACNINIKYHCDECTFADAWGRGCKHNLLLPIANLMSGRESCEYFKRKTKEQIEEQIKILEDEKETCMGT